jgi:hypothetical protein
MPQASVLLRHDHSSGVLDPQAFAMCIDAAFKAAQACMACSDICLAVEDTRLLIKCVRLNGDCADLCVATAWMLSREPHPDRDTMQKQIESCTRVCQETAAECERLATIYPHAKVCAAACKRCVASCLDALRQICRRR